MSIVGEGFAAILSGNAFANAFWVFVGVVAGALVQYALGLLVSRSQRRMAKRVLKTEVQINSEEVESFLERITYLRGRISAGQITESDLFFSMQGFDYSIVQPLVMSGHFHAMLGSKKVKSYFEFMRFFNNGNAQVVNSMLKAEHESGRSLNYLDWLDDRCTVLRGKLLNVVETCAQIPVEGVAR